MNWGYKLLFAFLAFGAMIFYLVFRAIGTDFELVEKEYYKSELRYQQVIDGTNRANQLSGTISLEQEEDFVNLELPAEMKTESVTGSVWFYCAYDKERDRKFELKPDDLGRQRFEVRAGTYTVKISWKASDKTYYAEKAFSVL